jgi:chaperonin GroEL (HSP60 family)
MRAKEVRVSSGLCPHVNNEGEASPFVSCVDISLEADQQLADFMARSSMKRSTLADESKIRVSNRLCQKKSNEGEASPSVSCVDISLEADQQLADFEVTMVRSSMKRSTLADESKIRVSNRLCQKKSNEGEASLFVSSIDISLQADQQAAGFKVTVLRYCMKRSVSADKSKVSVARTTAMRGRHHSFFFSAMKSALRLISNWHIPRWPKQAAKSSGVHRLMRAKEVRV